jgi:putative transposase
VKTAIYETNVSDAQWAILKPLLPRIAKIGRPPTDRRRVIDAILYVLKGGITWRMLPAGFPPWQTVYSLFRKWAREGVWEKINQALRSLLRKKHGRRVRPTAAVLDSQSVKSAGLAEEAGYDAGKKIKGRKRHLLVDTLGLVLSVLVTAASVPDRQGAQTLLLEALGPNSWLRRLWVDGGYSGPEFAHWVRELRPKLEVEVVKRSDDIKGFKVLPHRWVVERTFGWLMQHRRLVRDYERTATSSKAWIFLVMIRLQLRRLG